MQLYSYKSLPDSQRMKVQLANIKHDNSLIHNATLEHCVGHKSIESHPQMYIKQIQPAVALILIRCVNPKGSAAP